MQPYLFPYIGYFQLMHAVNKFIIFDDVTYIKGGWINRNRILVNKKDHFFTIPLKNASSNVLIKDIQIVENEKWQIKLMKTFEQSYKKSPYYKDVFPIINEVFSYRSGYIINLILASFQLINKYLDIETKIIHSSTIYNNSNLERQERIIDICKLEGANIYINAISGQNLYVKNKFKQSGINLFFIQANKYYYRQLSKDYYPQLSIIDVLMNCGKEKTKKLLQEYTLV